jgi:hypothetical protein
VRLRALVIGAAMSLIPALFYACGTPDLKFCGEIPSGGCPIGRGGTCDDDLCAALYDCVEGKWTRSVTCSGHGDAGSPDGGDAGGDGGPCTLVTFDHSGETTDCMPDLQEPDCPASVAEGCVERACTTGCADFFLCLAGSWQDVAYCDESSSLVVTQKPK